MAVGFNSGAITDGLIFCIDAGNPKCYPGSGTTVYNIAPKANRPSANGDSATMPSGMTYSAGPPASFAFDGTSSCYQTWGVGADWFNNDPRGGKYELTFEAWAKSPGMGASQTLGGIFGWTYGVRLYFGTSGNITGGHDVGDAITGLASGFSGQDDVWHHIVYTFGTAGAKIYVDGVFKNLSTTMRWLGVTRWSTNTCSLGRDNNNSIYNLYGNIAIARIYNRYFTGGNEGTGSDILRNFNADRKRFGV